jgi:hypothetical protein
MYNHKNHKINMDFSNVKRSAEGIADAVEDLSEQHTKGRFRHKGKKEFEGLELL